MEHPSKAVFPPPLKDAFHWKSRMLFSATPSTQHKQSRTQDCQWDWRDAAQPVQPSGSAKEACSWKGSFRFCSLASTKQLWKLILEIYYFLHLLTVFLKTCIRFANSDLSNFYSIRWENQELTNSHELNMFAHCQNRYFFSPSGCKPDCIGAFSLRQTGRR